MANINFYVSGVEAVAVYNKALLIQDVGQKTLQWAVKAIYLANTTASRSPFAPSHKR